ncbi:MAG: DNA-binding protein [Candidatus Cloacimonetes bacterium]|nr:DNA-binding protein [Candidatus Cloacimonadota bacterium]
MKSKKIDNGYIIRLETGEEIITSMKKFCNENRIASAKISGIGAVSKIEIGLFQSNTRKYISNIIEKDLELLSLQGNATVVDDESYIHLHIITSDINNTCFGGHLNYAFVSVTAEIFLEVFEQKIKRFKDIELGINLLKL